MANEFGSYDSRVGIETTNHFQYTRLGKLKTPKTTRQHLGYYKLSIFYVSHVRKKCTITTKQTKI